MKSVFNLEDRKELLDRIARLEENSERNWGRMTASQMVQHCKIVDQMYHGQITIQGHWIKYLLGKVFLKKILSSPSGEMQKNAITAKELVTRHQSPQFQEEKNQWLQLIQAYESLPIQEFNHPFFGKISRQQIGELSYIHANHHLKQFGC